jgi:16S rRNA (uracil1498-N3)-methyltransferase
MTRIFVDPAVLVPGELIVRGDEHHYLSHVRRARPGEVIELVDGHGRRAAATIARIGERETVLAAEAPTQIAAALPRLRALVPVIKGDRMDSCIEKLVEVGVDEIVVWRAARAVARLDDARLDGRIAKYQAIAQAAARQSGRTHIPRVASGGELAATVAGLPRGTAAPADPHDGASVQRLVLEPSCATALVALPTLPGAADITLISGPEGGIAPDELDQLAGAGFVPVGLGPRVLRAETAPVMAVAVIRAVTHT